MLIYVRLEILKKTGSWGFWLRYVVVVCSSVKPLIWTAIPDKGKEWIWQSRVDKEILGIFSTLEMYYSYSGPFLQHNLKAHCTRVYRPTEGFQFPKNPHGRIYLDRSVGLALKFRHVLLYKMWKCTVGAICGQTKRERERLQALLLDCTQYGHNWWSAMSIKWNIA